MSWKKEVYDLIKNKWDKEEIFNLNDIYKYEDHFEKLFPNNNHIRDKIRQILQKLRDENKIEFINNQGDYKIVKNTNKNEEVKEERKNMIKNTSLSKREIINKIKNYIKVRGFTYPDGMIENFYLSLKTKPFVLLAGISGTGKTKLVQLFADAIGCTSDNNQFKLISVKPDWNDSSDLLGYSNIRGDFQAGPMIKIIKHAMENEDKPHIVCLDEMNLARVEYYFSEFLSKMET